MLDLVLVAVSIGLSYLWVSLPELRPFSLQLTAGLFLMYFISKRLSNSRWHHILPTAQTIETALLTSAVTLVVGSTGSLESPFLPLFHLILFMSVLTISLPANLVKMVCLVLFLWATSPHPLTSSMTLELLSLPFLTPLMVFARLQWEEAREEKHLVELEGDLLAKQETDTLLFLTTFLKPKISYISGLIATDTPDNLHAATRQLQLLQNEIDATAQKIDQITDSLDFGKKK